jgi:membrane protein DedA with SNARE-associated domain
VLSELAGWTVGVVEKAGYWGLAGLVALENVFPPIPSEIVLPMAGFLTGQDKLVFGLAVAASTAGAVVGALVFYEIGRRLGEDRVRRFFKRRGKWLLLSECDFDKAENWFRRHGTTAVLFGRCVPGVRSYVSLPAGIQRMPIWKFIGFTALGSGVYNSILIGLGWFMGRNWKKISDYAGWFETALWVALAAAIGYWIYKKKFKPGQHAEEC